MYQNIAKLLTHLSIYMCMCLYICIYQRVCVFIYIFMCTCACIYIYMLVRICMYVYLYMMQPYVPKYYKTFDSPKNIYKYV